jgi:ketosteroid isomerase-like protein
MGETAVETIRRMYDTWNADGVEAFTAHCAPDVVWHDDPQLPDATTSEGVAAVVARFQDYIDAVGHFRIDPREVGELEDGRQYSIVTVTIRGEESGAEVVDDHVHVLRVSDGRLAEMWQYLDARTARRDLGLGAD